MAVITESSGKVVGTSVETTAVIVLQWRSSGAKGSQILICNTGGSNGITYSMYGYLTPGGQAHELQAAANIAANTKVLKSYTDPWWEIIVKIKDQADLSHSTYEVDWLGRANT